ncbi:hypothetical protein BSKO_05620 [Bryopsis sp. KO-2023]|nr:hypothetical protein BSKO_05620 [Bryopsis sp. KO-2023]
MGKHNGKARKSGASVGKALANRARMGPTPSDGKAFRHTTDLHQEQQSILEQSNLDEIMTMARIAGRDFTAERGKVVVLDAHAVGSNVPQFTEQERRQAEARVMGSLKVPRRPAWDSSTSAEKLDEQERGMFLNWRRGLARLEENEPAVVLTPFEKNLEVWRQLWRVLERSDIMVQVVDCRDPLLYRSEDLEDYAREINASKSTMLLLNKADLLPAPARKVWADYFDSQNIHYLFWSAKIGEEEMKAEKKEEGLKISLAENQSELLEPEDSSDDETDDGNHPDGATRGEDFDRVDSTAASSSAHPSGNEEASEMEDERVRVLNAKEVLERFEIRAKEAVQSASDGDPGEEKRLMVGLVGYPNVGKSSTINVLFGQKKTAVAPTPGKTKHFQTLHVSETLGLCDCPGLVFPQIAQSKAEMVAAGVIPIDRLVDVLAPVQAVAEKLGHRGLEYFYGVKLPRTKGVKHPLAAEVLAAVAVSRGWVRHGGLPDENRTGRLILKDFVSGKLLYFASPPGMPREATVEGSPDSATDNEGTDDEGVDGKKKDILLTPGDEDVLEDAAPMTKEEKLRKASHKFQKKTRRTKGNRGQQWNEDKPKTVQAFVKGRGTLSNGVLGSLSTVG